MVVAIKCHAYAAAGTVAGAAAGVAPYHMHTVQQYPVKVTCLINLLTGKPCFQPVMALTHTNLGAVHFPSAQTGMCVQAGT